MNRGNYFDDLTVADLTQPDAMRDCYDHFLEGNCLDLRCFQRLIRELFVDAGGEPYEMTEAEVNWIFDGFDSDDDGKIDEIEFRKLWIEFIVPILQPKFALLVIDVQNDFIDGSLAIRNCPAKQEGSEVVAVINKLLPKFDTVIYTYDWHPEDHISFVDNVSKYSVHADSLIKPEDAKVFDTLLFEGNPEFEQKLWPRHCVQNTWGSELHPQLKITDGAIFVYKGTNSTIDSYSAFWDNQKKSQTKLNQVLKDKGITDVFVCGLAYDYCVGSTAVHSLEFGFRTLLIENGCRGVDSVDIAKMKKQLISNRVCIVNTDDINDLLKRLDRRADLGLFLAEHALTTNHSNGLTNNS